MNPPWWAWALTATAGFAGISLICIRLSQAGLASVPLNAYLFSLGAIVFWAAGLPSGSDLRLPVRLSAWLLPLAAALFVGNYALVRAYAIAPNGGYVDAVRVSSSVLVTLIVALTAARQGKPVELNRWTVVGIIMCVLGAILVIGGARRSRGVPPKDPGQSPTRHPSS